MRTLMPGIDNAEYYNLAPCKLLMADYDLLLLYGAHITAAMVPVENSRLRDYT